MSATELVAALDQGTTSTRLILFDHQGEAVASAQAEHRQITPRPGWVEHDPLEIWENAGKVIREALQKGAVLKGRIRAVGITNQRETTVLWNRKTGVPYGNAVVWQDTRTQEDCEGYARRFGGEEVRRLTGLPVSTYFSAPKAAWLLSRSDEARGAALKGELCFGTIDSWLIYKLTGGSHITDVTNASRTLLMDLSTGKWHPGLTELFGLAPSMLPEIRPSSDPASYGETLKDGPFGELIPITGAVGDQQAALAGQAAFRPGDAKNTYGTGCFLLMNVGERVVVSSHGLLSTVAFKRGGSPLTYALEGSVAVAGSAVQWLRDQLGIIRTAAEVEDLARTVSDSGDVYFVPAFSGLFAPHWRPDARGAVVGLTRYATKAHLARAALEAVAYQTRDLVEAMEADSGRKLSTLKADGGMVENGLLMQLQADVLGVPVIRPANAEATALGAAYAAGLAVGYWKDEEEIRGLWRAGETWNPDRSSVLPSAGYARWKKAVERTLNWV